MSEPINTVVETGRGLYEAGVMQEGTLIELIDLKVLALEERNVELESIIRNLAYALWFYRDACDGDEKAQNDIQEALASVEAKYINFLD